MLDMPGWRDSQRLPNAVAVIRALKNTARVRLEGAAARSYSDLCPIVPRSLSRRFLASRCSSRQVSNSV